MIKRYDPEIDETWYQYDTSPTYSVTMQETPGDYGDWVKYEDHTKVVDQFVHAGWRWKFKKGQGPQTWNSRKIEPVRHIDWDVEEVFVRKN
jgi:hypothetical protein